MAWGSMVWESKEADLGKVTRKTPVNRSPSITPGTLAEATSATGPDHPSRETDKRKKKEYKPSLI